MDFIAAEKTKNNKYYYKKNNKNNKPTIINNEIEDINNQILILSSPPKNESIKRFKLNKFTHNISNIELCNDYFIFNSTSFDFFAKNNVSICFLFGTKFDTSSLLLISDNNSFFIQ
jgi:hypothetical protein